MNSVAFSPCGKWIASCSDDKTVRIWNAATGAPVGSPLTGHGAPVTQLEFRDATTLVSASDDGTTCFWDVESGAEKGQDAQGTHGEALAGERFAFSKRNSKVQVVGRFVVTAQGDFVRVYEVDEGVADKDVPGLFPGFVCMIFPDSSSVLIVLSTLVVRGKLEIRNPQKETILDLNHRKTAPQNS